MDIVPRDLMPGGAFPRAAYGAFSRAAVCATGLEFKDSSAFTFPEAQQ